MAHTNARFLIHCHLISIVHWFVLPLFWHCIQGFFTFPVTAPERGAFCCQDMRVMTQPVKQGSSKFSVAKDLYPLTKSKIGGYQSRPPFVAFGKQVEKQFAAGTVKRHKSKFVNNEQVISLQPTMQPTQESLITGLQQHQ